MKYTTAIVITAYFLASCQSTSTNQKALESAELKKEEPKKDLMLVPDSWIKNRAQKSEERLKSTEAGQVLLSSINAHGGLTKWFSNGPIKFRFKYQPIEGSKRDSYNYVDTWSVAAVQENADNRNIKWGKNSKNVWTFPDSVDVGINPRFWSTTPYYFVALPFVLADKGVILEKMAPKEYDGVTYDLIKASFKPGAGDSPDDYYVIYVHPESKLMGGLRYVVSYPGRFPDGGHTPEKFMDILDYQTSNGITIPTGYNTHWFKNGQPAEHITEISVSDFGFLPELEKKFFEMPKGAKVYEGW